MKIPVQPTITETAPGHLHVDQNEFAAYQRDMKAFEAAYNDAVKDVDQNDPYAIFNAILGLLGDE